jgi:hypothetical protein
MAGPWRRGVNPRVSVEDMTMNEPVYVPSNEELERERTYWQYLDRREEWAAVEIGRLQERIAELEEWVQEIAGDMLKRTQEVA